MNINFIVKGEKMDSKLKIKYRKNEKKYIIDYSKVKDRGDTRFELFQMMNSQEDIMVLLDTSLNKADPKQITTCYYDLKEDSSFKVVQNYLEESSYDYKLRRVKRHVPRTILGFSSGKTDIVEDILIAVHIPAGEITREFFDYLLCTHDIMIGIKPITPIASILRDFSSADFQRINEIEGFEYTLVDSHWMAYCYTDFEFIF